MVKEEIDLERQPPNQHPHHLLHPILSHPIHQLPPRLLEQHPRHRTTRIILRCAYGRLGLLGYLEQGLERGEERDGVVEGERRGRGVQSEMAGGEGGVGADLGGGVGKGGENEGEEGLWVEEKGGVVRVD